MNKIVPTLMLLFITISVYPLQDSYFVTGKVQDNTGLPLPGVTILEKGTTNGTVTDIDGTYALNMRSNQSVLMFSFVGYISKEEIPGERRSITVVLQQDMRYLDEVVVVGYGTVRKSDLTGSVSSVSVSESELSQLGSIEQILQGKAAGVMITSTSSKPGGMVSVKIRGNNSINAGNEPLYVIDGFPVTSNEWELSANMTSGGPMNPLATINPNDIESIEILKDASATAIYGARATNGVVLITTKRGQIGEGSINVNMSYGLQQIRKKLELMNAQQYAELVNEALQNAGMTTLYPDPSGLGKGTDWQDELFRIAPVTDLNVSLSGGRPELRYFLSSNYYQQEGIVVNTNLNRIAMRLGLDAEIKPWLSLGANLNLSNTSSRNIETAGWGVVNTALMFNPVLPVRDENGEYTLKNDRTIFTGNPVALAQEADSKANTNRAIANVFFQVNLLPSLFFKTQLGVDAGFNKETYYYPSYILAGQDVKGSAGIGNLNNTNLLNENTLHFHNIINERHDLNMLVGFTAQSSENSVNRMGVEGFTQDIMKYWNLGGASTVSSFPFSYHQSWRMLSYLGRINYSMDNKYLFSLNARLDGSSKFGKGNKYGFFPSFAFGWKLSEESFMADLEDLVLLKLRLSYGSTGNQDVASYQSLAVLGLSSYPFNSERIIGYHPIQIANPDLKWETTDQFNIGLDAGVLNNRIQITADYYYKRTKDLLLYVNLPISSGFSSALKNIGNVQNQGVELTLSSKNLTGSLRWNTDFNIAFNRNKVLSLAGEQAIPVSSRINQLDPGWLVVGKPIGLFYGLKTDGLFQTLEEVAESSQPGARPGDIKYIDYNNDGVINMDDRQLIGMSEPRFFGGILNTLSYKDLTITIFLQGTYGNDIWNGNLLSHEYPNGLYNQFTSALDRWSLDNPDAKVPRANALMQDAYPMDRFVEDGSYLRLKTITLSYDINRLINRGLTGKMTLYITAENLLTLTRYSGYDPEVNYFGKSYVASGYDWGAYPNTKNFVIGVKISF